MADARNVSIFAGCNFAGDQLETSESDATPANRKHSDENRAATRVSPVPFDCDESPKPASPADPFPADPNAGWSSIVCHS